MSASTNAKPTLESKLGVEPEVEDDVLVAILAKDKAHTLNMYLSCLEAQTWPKNRTHVYVRTNDNRDDTVKILELWSERVSRLYKSFEMNTTSISSDLKNYGEHEWNAQRFGILGAIRYTSVQKAREKKNCHYFV